MWRWVLVTLVLLSPTGASQMCHPPLLQFTGEPDVKVLPRNATSDESVELLVQCQPPPSSTPLEEITILFRVDSAPEGIDVKLGQDVIAVKGNECPTDKWLSIENPLRLSHPADVPMGLHEFEIVARAVCGGTWREARQEHGVWVPLEGTFEVGPAEQFARAGQNDDAGILYKLRSTYNAPVYVETAATHAEGPRMPAIIAPSRVSLDFGFPAAFERDVLVLVHTPHQNGHVNYNTTYWVDFSVRVIHGHPPEFFEGGEVARGQSSFTVNVSGAFAPGAGAILLLAAFLGVLAWRRRRDA